MIMSIMRSWCDTWQFSHFLQLLSSLSFSESLNPCGCSEPFQCRLEFPLLMISLLNHWKSPYILVEFRYIIMVTIPEIQLLKTVPIKATAQSHLELSLTMKMQSMILELLTVLFAYSLVPRHNSQLFNVACASVEKFGEPGNGDQFTCMSIHYILNERKLLDRQHGWGNPCGKYLMSISMIIYACGIFIVCITSV